MQYLRIESPDYVVGLGLASLNRVCSGCNFIKEPSFRADNRVCAQWKILLLQPFKIISYKLIGFNQLIFVVTVKKRYSYVLSSR